MVQRAHLLGKEGRNGPRPILVRFFHYAHEEVLQKAPRKLKDTNFAVYEGICKDVYDIRQSQMPFSAKHNPIVYLLMLKYSSTFNFVSVLINWMNFSRHVSNLLYLVIHPTNPKALEGI